MNTKSITKAVLVGTLGIVLITAVLAPSLSVVGQVLAYKLTQFLIPLAM